MKRQLLFSLVFFVTTLVLTSCLDDKNNDDDKTITLTKQEIALRNMMLHGTWEGKLYYTNTTTGKADSLSTIWTGDSVTKTISFQQFPFRLLANYLDGEAKKAIAECDDQPLSFRYSTPTTDYAKNDNMQYFVYGFAPDDNVATFAVDNEIITIHFAEALTDYTATYRPIATYYQRTMQANILIGSVEYQKKTYSLNRLMSIGGNKIAQ